MRGYLAGSTQISGGGRDGAVAWNRDSEFPGGGDYFHAASGGGNRKAEGILRRRALGDCGADRGDSRRSWRRD